MLAGSPADMAVLILRCGNPTVWIQRSLFQRKATPPMHLAKAFLEQVSAHRLHQAKRRLETRSRFPALGKVSLIATSWVLSRITNVRCRSDSDTGLIRYPANSRHWFVQWKRPKADGSERPQMGRKQKWIRAIPYPCDAAACSAILRIPGCASDTSRQNRPSRMCPVHRSPSLSAYDWASDTRPRMP